jgi:hypothetical protein
MRYRPSRCAKPATNRSQTHVNCPSNCGVIELDSGLVTSASNPWADEWGKLSRQPRMREQCLGRRQARRLSRRFAQVGVDTAPQRLQQMVAGAPVPDDEVTDVHFALIATQIKRDERAAKFERLQRRGTRFLIFLGLVLVMLNFLCCVAYLLVSLTQQA